jgi:hypothetical protein
MDTFESFTAVLDYAIDKEIEAKHKLRFEIEYDDYMLNQN